MTTRYGVAQRGQVAPDRDECALDRVLGAVEVAQDPVRDLEQAVADRTGQALVGLPVPRASSIHQGSVHPASSEPRENTIAAHLPEWERERPNLSR